MAPEEHPASPSENGFQNEFAFLLSQCVRTKQNSEEFEKRGEELIQRFVKENAFYQPVLNGHLLVEDLLNQLLFESVNHPDCLRDGFGFADRLSILQAVSPLPSTSLLWRLLAKLNTLRNAVAHGKAHTKLAQLIQELKKLMSGSALGRPGDPDRPDWIIGFAFSAAVTDLDRQLSMTRLRKRADEFLRRLPLDHSLRRGTRTLQEMIRLLGCYSHLEEPESWRADHQRLSNQLLREMTDMSKGGG